MKNLFTNSFIFWIILLLSSFLSENFIAQTTVNLVTSADTYISNSNTSYNYGTQTYMKITRSSSTPRGSLLKWDVSSIPGNAVITSVSLTVNISTAASQTYYLYNLKRNWIEGTGTGKETNDGATWKTYDGTNNWGTDGAANIETDRDTDNLWDAGSSSFSSTGIKTINFNTEGLAVVQGWVSGTLPNYGVTIQDYSSSSSSYDLQLSTRNNSTAANHPTLNITYTVSLPGINTSGTLTNFNSQPGSSSAIQTYSVSGLTLADNISITAPTGFQVSTDGESFSSSATLIQQDGSITATTIYVRLISNIEGLFSGNIVHTSTGYENISIPVSGTVSIAPSWTAYNDCAGTSSGNTTTYTITSGSTAGLLKDFTTGNNTPVTATITSSGDPQIQTGDYGGAETVAGTDAYTTFHDYSDVAGVIQYGDDGWWVDVTFTGLDPNKTYTFATTANRDKSSYTRETKFTISNITSAVNSSSSGVSVISNESVYFNTGYNTTNGYVVKWTNIYPSSEGSFTVRAEANSSTEAYAFSVFMLQEEASSGPAIITSESLTTFSTQPGVPSEAQTYTVSGINLSDDITISAPSGFEISTDATTYTSSLFLEQTEGLVSETTIYVRLYNLSEGLFSGNITHTSDGVTTKTIAVLGSTNNGWVAYNDGGYIDGQIATNITTYECYTNGASGLLTDYYTDVNTTVSVSIATSGTINSQLSGDQIGTEANEGTDAYNTFHGLVNMLGGSRLGSNSSTIQLTFTGLNPDNTYSFATTANRNDDGYDDRFTRITISDAESATNASTSGVTVNNDLSVSFCTGYNTVNGYVARWTDINPGSDGGFIVTFAVEGEASSAYGPSVFMLKEGSVELPDQYTLTVNSGENGSVTLSPSGTTYISGTTVTLTPVPNTNCDFTGWTGTNACDLSDNGNGTWSILMNEDKVLSASFINNEPPANPVLVNPLNNATGISTSALLQVTVSDPDVDPLTVSFYGRKVGEEQPAEEEFSLLVYPDTQAASQNYPQTYNAMSQYVVDNKNALNIAFVTHVGDIVQTANNNTEWQRADAAMDILNVANIPYSVGPGNHDLAIFSSPSYYNTYFGPDRFTGNGYYQGSYATNENENNYSFFSAAGMDFILINLQYNSTSEHHTWAGNLLKAYPNRRGIIAQHNILNTNNSWQDQSVYTDLKDNPNLFLMLCGHMHSSSDGSAYRTETGDNGNTVHILMTDFQDFANGGNGYMRILKFTPQEDKIYAQIYSPTLGTYLTNATNYEEFSMDYDMTGTSAIPFTHIGTLNNVSSGTNAAYSWAGLETETEYEWYITVSDGYTSTTSDTWKFTTGSTTIDYTLTVNNDVNGTVALSPEGNTHVSGTTVTLTPTPNENYQFDSWTGNNAADIQKNEGVFTILMNSDKNITANFIIIPSEITVTYPDITTTWQTSSNQTITWTSTGFIENVRINYSYDNGENWSTIINETPNDGSYEWTIPDISSDVCLIKISDFTNESLFALSNLFSIDRYHFTPVWQGTNGYNHMNFYVLTATIDGVNMNPGDEIGIFDGNLCVGSGKLSQILDGNENILSIVVSMDDPITGEIDGFTPGNTASYKLWDAALQTEITYIIPTYNAGLSGTFVSKGTSEVHLNGLTTITQTITLNAGWNIFSLYIEPSSTLMSSLLQPLMEQDVLVKIQNEQGQAITKLTNDNWAYGFTNWEATEGYHINVSEDVVLTISGTPLASPQTIPLTNGWNIISYPVGSQQLALDVLSDIINNGYLVKVQDEQGNAIEYLGSGSLVDYIETFYPGEGYHINVNSPCNLEVSESTNPSPSAPMVQSLKSAINLNNSYFRTPWKGHGFNHMNIYIDLTALNGASISVGDEIAVFDGNTCVGKTTIENPSKLISLTASQDDPTTVEIDGFTEGNRLSFKLWSGNTETNLNPNEIQYAIGYTDLFEPKGTTLLSLKAQTTPVENLFAEVGDVNIYPNPFSNEVNISFYTEKTEEFTVSIFNAVGQQIFYKDLTTIKGNNTYTWNPSGTSGEQLSPGIYIVKITSKNSQYNKTKKLSKK